MDLAYDFQRHSESTLFQFIRIKLEDTYPTLANENNDVWQEIVNQANIISFPENTKLLQPNTPCMQFMLLLEGCVRIYQQTRDDREATLYRIHGGDLCVLSINSLIEQKQFGAFAQCETELTALTFSREQFMQAMAIYEPFRVFILKSITRKFNDVLTLIEETVFENLDTRLVCLLMRLAKNSNTDTLYITHQELARELGSSREVISRILKGIEKQGCIKLGRGVIQILD